MNRIRLLLIAASFAVAALVAPAAASAATVSVSGGTASFAAATGETNHLSVSYSGASYIQFYDSGVTTMTAGAGCQPVPFAPQKVVCPRLGLTAITIDLGDGNDSVNEGYFYYTIQLPTTIFGGPGDDNIQAGAGNDTISGGTGNDTINGNSGNDTIDGNEGADTIDGGFGFDTVTYADRTAPVNVSLDGVANDGEAGEGDNVRSGVNEVVGGSGNDVLTGDNFDNTLIGNDGNDTLAGLGGNDTLDGGGGTDSFDGGAGADVIRARDGVAESIACGTEADAVTDDYSDTAAADCEVVDSSVAPPDPPPVTIPTIPPPPTGGGTVVEPPVAAIAPAPAPVSASGVVTVRLRCPSEAFQGCGGTLTIELLTGGKSSTVSKKLISARRRKLPTRARRHFKIAAGKAAHVPVKLDRRTWRKFRGRRHLKAVVTVTMRNSAGVTSTTRTVSLKARRKPPPKKKPPKKPAHRRRALKAVATTVSLHARRKPPPPPKKAPPKKPAHHK
jgi:RTX calcium-binding nonapeptide repeat (4 copies)